VAIKKYFSPTKSEKTMNLYVFVDNRVNMLCMHTSIWTLFELPMNNETNCCIARDWQLQIPYFVFR